MGAKPDTNRATILYVEDNEDDVLFMQVAFAKAGLSPAITHVEDGHQALDYLAGNGLYGDRQLHPLPSLLLLDLKLPRTSGFELLKWVRTQPALKHLKVVVVSGSGQQRDLDLARQLGATDYVIKPSSPTHLSEILKKGWGRWISLVGSCNEQFRPCVFRASLQRQFCLHS